MEKKSTWNILALSCALVLIASIVTMSGCIESSKGKTPISVEIGKKEVEPLAEWGEFWHQYIAVKNNGRKPVSVNGFIEGYAHVGIDTFVFSNSLNDYENTLNPLMIPEEFGLDPGEAKIVDLKFVKTNFATDQPEIKAKIVIDYIENPFAETFEGIGDSCDEIELILKREDFQEKKP